ncbi:MAG: CHASE2 domain-containing protein, partial [Merismopedia sp. SIO2A8]|nr:CHASE2 domain-containing protein [Merismopedia sp. SIO2A8]
TVKVLKILLETYPKAVDLFKREFKVLSQLQHPGIPRVDPDGYFIIPSADSPQPSHCLIMERIPGVDLRKWLRNRNNAPISEMVALDWLTQLAEILEQLHQHHCFHRDIKPSNIMLRPDGQLVLIDFGAVREMTETFLHKKEGDITSTHLYSRGYTPMEQIQGRAVPESDFFALGRTFVHLITGCNPLDFPSDLETGVLLWRDRALHVTVAFADFIDQLMAPFVAQRPDGPQAILARIQLVQAQIASHQTELVGSVQSPQISPLGSASGSASETFPLTTIPPDAPTEELGEKGVSEQKSLIGPVVLPESSPPVAPWEGFSCAAICAVVATAGVVGVRTLGLLQGTELAAFDQLMRWRSPEPLDERMVLVTIDSEDLAYQNEQGWGRQGSLSDEALALLLTKLNPYEPRLIGLDIYRSSDDLGINPGSAAPFREAWGQQDNLIAVCAVAGGAQNHPAIAPPDEVPLERIGFSNIPYDPDGQVRRQILGMDPDETCDTSWSLSARLALRYLREENLEIGMNDEGTLRVGDRPLPRFVAPMGPYQHPSLRQEGGYQLTLNYHSSPFLAPQLPLSALLRGELDDRLSELIVDRIVLIGTIDRSYRDYHPTPYGSLPGVVIQAHMTSQVLRAVLDDRPLLWSVPLWADSLWIMGWSLVIGGIMVVVRSPWQQGCGVLVAVGGLTGLSFILLLQGGWMPLIPSVSAIALTIAGIKLWPSSLSFSAISGAFNHLATFTMNHPQNR